MISLTGENKDNKVVVSRVISIWCQRWYEMTHIWKAIQAWIVLMQYVKRKINNWTYFWVMQSVSSVRKIDNMTNEWLVVFYSMFREKLRKSDLFTRCFLKVNILLTMWSNCVSLSFILFLLMLLFSFFRLLESTARNVHIPTNDQINIYVCERLFNDFHHAHTSLPICKMRFCIGTRCEYFYSCVLYYRKIWSFVLPRNWQAIFNWKTHKCLYMFARARPWAQNCNWKRKIKHRHGRASGDDRKRAIMGLSPNISHCRLHSSFEIANLSFFDLLYYINTCSQHFENDLYAKKWNVQLDMLMYVYIRKLLAQ